MLEQIKEECNFDEIKDAFDVGSSSLSLNIFLEDNENFLQACNFLYLSEDKNEFVPLLRSDIGQNIMTNNSLSLGIETGEIFNNDFSTKKNFYNFLLDPPDNFNHLIPKQMSYHYSFEKYTCDYLRSFSLDKIDRLDCCQIKMHNFCCVDLMTRSNQWMKKNF